MSERRLTEEKILRFHEYLIQEEKSSATVEKYIRDVRAFAAFAGGADITKEVMMDYKEHLLEQHYAARSVNSMLASLNSLLVFLGWMECRVKSVRLQKSAYCPEERELTRAEYERLLLDRKSVV